MKIKRKLYDYAKGCIVLLVCSLILPLLSGCHMSKAPISKTGFYFDTVITITLYDGKDTSSILDTCFSMCDQYEKLFSRTLEGSDIWKINHADGATTTVSDATIDLLEQALYYADLSDGVVDPTIAPLSAQWDFSTQASSDHPVIPDDDTLQSLLQHVDYHNIIIEGNNVTLTDPEAAIDLGFIAKGYIADQLKEYLTTQNVTSAIINLGGNVLTIGNKPSGEAFQIGVQKPFGPQNNPLLSLSVDDSSVVSSGCYERYFEIDGKRYHHILDTTTGYPVDNNLLGVTILSKLSTDGDGLSTLCYALGLEKGMALINSLPDVEAIFILDDYHIEATSGVSYTLLN